MKRLALPALFALAACATDPAVRTEVVNVNVPVPVFCVEASQIPDDPAPISDQLTGDAATDIGPISIIALRWKQVAGTMRALLAGCVEP